MAISLSNKKYNLYLNAIAPGIDKKNILSLKTMELNDEQFAK